MTSSQPPDPKTLASWEDAFHYPLPVVRKLEQQLRKNIDDNRQKLRSLVGASYRDLLGTAERIIDMDEQIQHVEWNMGEIGRKCNTRNLEKIRTNHQRVRRERESSESVRLRRIAQTRVLQNAVNATLRTVKRGGDALVAAKLLVLARLLHQSLADGEDPPAVLEDLRNKLGTARTRLLRYIARTLSRMGVDRATILQTLCAYALLSASAPKDVLRYFLQVRFEQLDTLAEKATEASLVDMLALYSQTLLDTREFFPRRFVDSLSQITTTPLVRDPDVQAMYELGLDVYERWITDDVRNFHPWVRQDELPATSVGDAAVSWARQAQECLLRTLKEALTEQQDVNAVLQLRQKVISKYLVLSSKLRNDTQARALEDLQKAFLDHLESLAGRAAAMADIIPKVPRQISNSEPTSKWDLAVAQLDLTRGSAQFRKDILSSYHGRNHVMDDPNTALDQWLSRLRSFSEAIATMRGTKWDDDLDLDLDDLTDDEPPQVVLSKQDPQQLGQKLHAATIAALRTLHRTVEESFESETDPALLVRILREVDDRRRSLAGLFENIDSIKPSDAFIAALHQRVAESVAAIPVKRFATAVSKPTHVAVALWDGTPSLPVQPSPTTFRFLKDLHRHMSDSGKDLWSPAAVKTLQMHLCDILDEKAMLAEIDQSVSMTLTSGHADADPTEEKSASVDTEEIVPRVGAKERLIQQLFDILYLQRVLLAGSPGSKLEKVADKLRELLEPDSAICERLIKNATEYWRRTQLLFGLLAPAQTP